MDKREGLRRDWTVATVVSVLIAWLFSCCVSAQSLPLRGDWSGELLFSGMRLPIAVHLRETEHGLTGTLDSPNQGLEGVIMNRLVVEGGRLLFEIKSLGVLYQGDLDAGSGEIEGVFEQNGLQLALALRPGLAAFHQARPQTPLPPYPYRVEDVLFTAEDGVSLAGTLSLPDAGKIKAAAVLISGSGAQDRDVTLFGHKPFWVIADYLARRGYATLRLDDRGVGGSGGSAGLSTSEDFAADIETAIEYLRDRNDIPDQLVGLIGHSEGAMIASMLASRRKDVAFLILLAGPGIPGHELLAEQRYRISLARGVVGQSRLEQRLAQDRELFARIAAIPMTEEFNVEIKSQIRAAVNMAVGGIASAEQEGQIYQTTLALLESPWTRFFLQYAPEAYLDKYRGPVLALNGTRDLQVPVLSNLEGIRRILVAAEHPDFNIKALPELNHLFQHSETGLPSEYSNIEETFSTEALDFIGQWLDHRF